MKNIMTSFGIHRQGEWNPSDGGYFSRDYPAYLALALYIFALVYCVIVNLEDMK